MAPAFLSSKPFPGPSLLGARSYPSASLAALSAVLCFGCDDGIGDPGTRISEPLSSLSGGVVFSTWVLPGADGYDLFWSPIRGTTPGNVQDFIPLTTAGGDDTQPSIAANGQALVFAREDQGIMRIQADGEITRVSDVRDTEFLDSLPALSADASRVAWVREDRSRPIGNSGFFATEIWVANADGAEARAINPKPDVVQDAPAFHPSSADRLAWSEFNAATLGPSGPVDYGIWMHDLIDVGGRFVCDRAYSTEDGGTVRCFGQHLAWPEPNRIVLSQQFLEIDPESGPVLSRLPALLNSLESAPGGSPFREPSLAGFFPPFPLSASFLGSDVLLDGLYLPVDGDQLTLAFFVTSRDGSSPFRFQVAGHQADVDPNRTGGYLFSLSTPQLVP